jgi:hypothetical protein
MNLLFALYGASYPMGKLVGDTAPPVGAERLSRHEVYCHVVGPDIDLWNRSFVLPAVPHRPVQGVSLHAGLLPRAPGTANSSGFGWRDDERAHNVSASCVRVTVAMKPR